MNIHPPPHLGERSSAVPDYGRELTGVTDENRSAQYAKHQLGHIINKQYQTLKTKYIDSV